ncbi:MAG: transglycosylase domain-containing protein [Alicyclobacillus macrosporangiidus]|uniref:transglycosylase domain-containing protein n=1 Tax=Alicyclobacillus macrosporangiidus TaxID=392015 RepID=UPI0026ED37A0|nr:transglycosylase domain-containing protein [Alicyclobacillus macrosporangiidus]MCL6601224.1 transglycosylase domain-containing protein [Alicyclobacillus macrosporangiidus]
MRRFVRRLVKLFIFLLVAGCVSWCGLKVYFTRLHPIAPKVRQEVLAQIQAHESRFLTYDQIPEVYRKAVIATEDRSFFTNIGVDFQGIARAMWVDIRQWQPIQGGSTITQQLVHNTLLKDIPKSLSWKVKETLYAIGIYDTLSKQETFALYANDIYFGQGAYGLYAAAQTYFGRAPSELNAGELTLLAGLPNAPSDYNPFRHMELARERQRIVVQSMVDDGMITQAQAADILREPIRLRSNR